MRREKGWEKGGGTVKDFIEEMRQQRGEIKGGECKLEYDVGEGGRGVKEK